MNKYGMLRITCASPIVAVGNPAANVREMVSVLGGLAGSDVVVFPELSITGYTCGDLFGQSHLLREAADQLHALAGSQLGQASAPGRDQIVIVGLPVEAGPSLYNCAAVLHRGTIAGIVPKQFLPNYKEFYEGRWFKAADGTEPQTIRLTGNQHQTEVPFGIDLLFPVATESSTGSAAASGALIGIEICEDLWGPIPPSSFQAISGANVLINLSASNETVGKSRYRRELVGNQSGRCIAAYAYCSSGPTESTSDLVFGGHSIIAENGSLLKEQDQRWERTWLTQSCCITADVDIDKLQFERRRTTSFGQAEKFAQQAYRKTEPLTVGRQSETLERTVSATPFVPQSGSELHARCEEIFGIQCAALAKRVQSLPSTTPFVIGISGGLDSTLALLVAVKTCDLLGLDCKRVQGVTMPGFGTSQRTRSNAVELMRLLGITQIESDIRPLSIATFNAIGHIPFGTVDCSQDAAAIQAALSSLPAGSQDLRFENVQARIRTLLLMSRGFVLGTGDMSELALGWCTYNGDHMSMYNVNCSIPKTLVKFLVKYVAETEFDGDARRILLDVVDTEISPELLPVNARGESAHSTESAIGPYELHDFFLANLLRDGSSPEKIIWLAEHARFSRSYSREDLTRWLNAFFQRFFASQFKRDCVPNGPKVGSVSLSPRGDWRMPSDADGRLWSMK